MRRLETEGKCLFCPAHLDTQSGQRVLMRTESWSVTENKYPYHGAKLHLLLIPSLHVTDILALPENVLADFWVALALAKKSFELNFYGLGARCGECRYTGGTIQHLHIHLIVGDVEDANHEGVRLKLSSRPESDD